MRIPWRPSLSATSMALADGRVHRGAKQNLKLPFVENGSPPFPAAFKGSIVKNIPQA